MPEQQPLFASPMDPRDAALLGWCRAHKVEQVLPDCIEANEIWGANCGPMSLAATLGFKTVEAVKPLVEPFRGFMSPKDMLEAMEKAGATVEVKRIVRKRTPWPRCGLVRIQWVGSWCGDNVNPRAAYRYTHWIGVRHPPVEEATALNLSNRELLVYDATPNCWVPMTVWSMWCPTLWPKGTTDWYVASCFAAKTEDDHGER